jgi:hypothetical protein
LVVLVLFVDNYFKKNKNISCNLSIFAYLITYMTKEKLINWICNDYITNIKYNNWEEEDWYYLIEKAFNLNNMSLEELKNFKKELTE